MRNPFKNLFTRRLKPKPYLLFDKYEVVPAFDLQGKTYFMHKDPLNTCVGRGLTSMVFYEELLMRCNVDYLKEYCTAVREIFSNPKSIDILQLAKLTTHLEERVNFLAAVPEHVYKMASVVFFTEDESAFHYDFQKGQEKIKAWEATPGMYDFFLRTPLKDLIPSLALPEQSSENYLAVQEKISALHFKSLREVLSKKESILDRMN